MISNVKGSNPFIRLYYKIITIFGYIILLFFYYLNFMFKVYNFWKKKLLTFLKNFFSLRFWKKNFKRLYNALNWFNADQRKINQRKIFLSFKFSYKWPRLLLLPPQDLSYVHRTFRYKAYRYAHKRYTLYELYFIKPIVYTITLIWNFITIFFFLHLCYWILLIFFYSHLNWTELKLINFLDIFTEEFYNFNKFNLNDLTTTPKDFNVQFFKTTFSLKQIFPYDFNEMRYKLTNLHFYDILNYYYNWKLFFTVDNTLIINPIKIDSKVYNELYKNTNLPEGKEYYYSFEPQFSVWRDNENIWFTRLSADWLKETTNAITATATYGIKPFDIYNAFCLKKKTNTCAFFYNSSIDEYMFQFLRFKEKSPVIFKNLVEVNKTEFLPNFSFLLTLFNPYDNLFSNNFLYQSFWDKLPSDIQHLLKFYYNINTLFVFNIFSINTWETFFNIIKEVNTFSNNSDFESQRFFQTFINTLMTTDPFVFWKNMFQNTLHLNEEYTTNTLFSIKTKILDINTTFANIPWNNYYTKKAFDFFESLDLGFSLKHPHIISSKSLPSSVKNDEFNEYFLNLSMQQITNGRFLKNNNANPLYLFLNEEFLWNFILQKILWSDINYTVIFLRAFFFVILILSLIFYNFNLHKFHHVFILIFISLIILLFDILNINKYFYYFFMFYFFFFLNEIFDYIYTIIDMFNATVLIQLFRPISNIHLLNNFDINFFFESNYLFFWKYCYSTFYNGIFLGVLPLLLLFLNVIIKIWKHFFAFNYTNDLSFLYNIWFPSNSSKTDPLILNTETHSFLWDISFIQVDSISYTLILLTVIIIILCAIYLYQRKKYLMKDFVEWMVYLSFLQLGLIGAFSAHDIFSFFIFFELTLIPIYLLMIRFGSKERKIRAAYLIVLYTFFGSIFLFFNILIIFSKIGSTDYSDLFYISNFFSLNMQLYLWLFFFIAFIVKIPTFPFHIWLPEAHVEAPTLGSVILAALMLKLGLYGIIKFNLLMLANITDFVRYYVYFFSLISIFLSGFISIRQTDIKKIIAYSSIGHMNLILLGLYTLSLETFEGCIFQMFNHGLISAGLFFCIGFLYDRYYTRSFSFYGGLVIICPLTAFFFFLFILSNISFPLTNSFIAEFLIYAGMYNKSDIIVYISSLNMILVAIYSMKLYSHIFFGNFNNRLLKTKDLSYREFIILFFLIFNIILTGIFSDIFMQLLHFDILFYLEKIKLF